MSNSGNNASSSSLDQVNTISHLDDVEVERTLVTNLRLQLVEVRHHYHHTNGRILIARLRALQSLADERSRDLDEWDAPEEDDVENTAAYAAARSFLGSLRRIIAKMWTGYRTNNSRITAGMLREMEELVEARAGVI